MISVKRGTTILTKRDPEVRNEMIGKLTKADAKYLLKQCMAVMQGGNLPADTN